MNKKGFTLVELLSVIVIIVIISSIAYPKVLDIIGNSRLTAYNTVKKNIIDSAKIKYLADINNADLTEYSVKDLIKDGLIKKDIKNPLTDKEYDNNTRVLVTNEDGNISYKYIEGNTLYDIVKNKKNDGIYVENGEILYKGNNSQNYLVFNSDVYRIFKIDKYHYVYLFKETDNLINKNDIDVYIKSFYNDNYDEKALNKIIGNVNILSNEIYKKTLINNNSFINSDNNIWIKDNNEYKAITIDNEFTNEENAKLVLILKLNNNVLIKSGDGTQINPYIIEN